MVLSYTEFVTVVEWATVIVTFVMIGSGLPVCVNMYKQKSTKKVPYVLFLISALVSSLSLQYAFLKRNSALILINIISLLVWGIYASSYIVISKSKALPLFQMISVAGIYKAHDYYLKIIPTSSIIPTLGNYMIIWCTIAYMIPAADIYTMVQEKSSKSCDMPLLCGGTLSAAVWYLYGFLMNDVYIYFPSIPALLINGIKFGLMFLYGRPSKHTPVVTPAKNEDEYAVIDSHERAYGARAREDLRQRNC